MGPAGNVERQECAVSDLIVPTLRSPGPGAATLDERVYDRLLRERIIFLGSVVEDTIANLICAQLLLLAAEDATRDIYLSITSPGVLVTAGLPIHHPLG